MLRIELIADAQRRTRRGAALGRRASSGSIGSTASARKSIPATPTAARRAHGRVPEHIGSLALRESGGAVVSLRDGFYALNFETGDCRKLVDPDPGKPRIRMNDGKVDRRGRFVAGYMDYEEREPLCSLFRLDPDGAVAEAGRRHRLLQRPVLEPGRPHLLFRRHQHARHLGL